MIAAKTPRHLPRNKATLQVKDIHQLHLGEVSSFSHRRNFFPRLNFEICHYLCFPIFAKVNTSCGSQMTIKTVKVAFIFEKKRLTV